MPSDTAEHHSPGSESVFDAQDEPGAAQDNLNGEAAKAFTDLYDKLKEKYGRRAAKTGLAWAAEEKGIVRD